MNDSYDYYDYTDDGDEVNSTTFGNDSQTHGTDDYGYEYHDYPYEDYLGHNSFYDEFLYEGFDFERPIYVFIWESLVILTTLFNLLVIIVLFRMKIRNVIHVVLVAIAISDSLTGLVTLPTYIYVYQQHEPGQHGARDAYVLDKVWCNAFMISKFFISKWFHTVSIWLTLILGVQRFVSVILPFKAQTLFNRRNTLACVVVVFLVSPFLHIYHAITSKANADGFCQWTLDDKWGLAYVWLTLLLMHLIPCIALLLLSAVMICRLYSATSQALGGDDCNSSMKAKRQNWNRRMTIIVTTIVIAFLIPEIPYGIFLLYTVIRVHSGKHIMTLEANRIFHAVYEIVLVLSFHANFWIYTILNKRFRSELARMFREIGRAINWATGRPISFRKFSVISRSSSGRTAESDLVSKSGIKLKNMQGSSTSDSK